MKRRLKIKPTYECRCDGRLQTKRFTRLSYTGLVPGPSRWLDIPLAQCLHNVDSVLEVCLL
jgi:hypothetical protein